MAFAHCCQSSYTGYDSLYALWLRLLVQDVCDVAGWSSPLTFVKFYELDLASTPGSGVLTSSDDL